MKLHVRRGADFAVAAVVCVVAFSIYGVTLGRAVSSFDVAEMQVVPAVLGVTHPTGYPLWTLMGYAWTRLSFGSPALMMNVLSAGLFAGSAGAAALIAIRLGCRRLVAAIGGVTFALAGETWSRATEVDVHSLHTLLVALTLLAWITAEQTGSKRAALLMVWFVGLGLAHHRLALITTVPIVGWFFVRNLGWLRSPRFLLLACALGCAPLLLYFYLPLHGGDAPIVDSEYSHGWLAVVRGDVLRGNYPFWSPTSLGTWLDKLPSYTHIEEPSLAWILGPLAIVGLTVVVRKQRAIAAGLLWVLLISTYGLANRTDFVDYRWLIVPLLVVAVLASVGVEQTIRIVPRFPLPRPLQRGLVIGVVALLWAGVPTLELTSGYSLHDRSRDHRDEIIATRILRALNPHAVLWSYWDERTALLYQHFAKGLRPDVDILDHRSYVTYKSISDADVALAAASDPRYANRPMYVIPGYGAEGADLGSIFAAEGAPITRSAPTYAVRGVLRLDDLPDAFDFRGSGWLYTVIRPAA